MLALILAAAVAAQSPFDAAVRAYNEINIASAKQLFADAAAHDADPHRRARAAIWLANIAWHIDHDAPAARKWLDTVTDEETIPAAWIERARMDSTLTNDFAAAREEAAHAIGAPKPTDHLRAVSLHAGALILPAMRGTKVERAQLEAAKKELRDAIALVGPMTEASRLLLDAAIVTDDGTTALAAWRAYYGATAQSAILAPAEKALANWSDRRGAGLALARSGLFAEAEFVLRGVPADPAISDVRAYASTLEQVKTLSENYFRDVALKHADVRAFRASLQAAGETLWNALSWSDKPPRYSQEALTTEIGRRFNAVVRAGNSSGVEFNLHYAHKALDERRTISQFGREAPLQFVVLDGVIANAFNTWLGPAGGDGGWADDDAIYQVRPMYANDPLNEWLITTNPTMRAQRDRNTADETARDDGRASVEPVRFFPGVQLRIKRQYDDGIIDELKRGGANGDALRTAFIARDERDEFESSIWAHEGRHAIDKKYDHLRDSAELEYRAKLSQLEFAPSARHAIIDIAGGGNPDWGDTPHGKANRRIAQALFVWMKAHTAEIAGVDASKPLMLQLDKLTEDQLRAAARAADPLAK